MTLVQSNAVVLINTALDAEAHNDKDGDIAVKTLQEEMGHSEKGQVRNYG
jgi:hypothetical protein